MRPKHRICVIGPEEDAAILRCVLHHSGWAEPSKGLLGCRMAFVITGTLKTPIGEAQDALRRARGASNAELGQLPIIVLHRADQGAAMITASLQGINLKLRGRLIWRQWDRDWFGTLDAARVVAARKPGPRKAEPQTAEEMRSA